MANCSKGWEKRCPASKGHKCTCACGGENHGKDRKKQEGHFVLPNEDFDRVAEELREAGCSVVATEGALFVNCEKKEEA